MGISKKYPFDCIQVESDEKKVMELFQIMREDGAKKGYTPVIIIEDDHGLMEENILIANEEFGSFDNFTRECLESYDSIDVKSFLKERQSQYKDKNLQEEAEVEEEFYEACNSLYIGEKGENVVIAKVPVLKPYEIFAYIPMGGFNDCPDNQYHMAIAKYWYEKYGAIPVCIGNDTIQFMVSEPVKDEKDLKDLSLEQYLYCGDIVWQGVKSINNLKNSLQNSIIWYFWWA